MMTVPVNIASHPVIRRPAVRPRTTVGPMAREDHRDARRDHRREERRAQLLDDAIEAIREVGPGATMEQLARRGGVTKPILYRHFGDRDGLIAAIAERFSAEVLGSVGSALQTGGTPRDLIERSIDAYLSFIEREPSLYRFLLQQAVNTAGLVQASPLVGNVARQVAQVMGEELRREGVDSGPAVPWAYGVVGLVHQAGDWWLDDRTMTRPRLVGYLTDLIWGGLSTAAGTVGAQRDT
jgi:AcrR family transcriptional regulator